MSDKGYIIMLAPFQNMSMRWIFFQIFKWLWSNLKNMQVLFKTKNLYKQWIEYGRKKRNLHKMKKMTKTIYLKKILADPKSPRNERQSKQ